jgi:hypothetical protein
MPEAFDPMMDKINTAQTGNIGASPSRFSRLKGIGGAGDMQRGSVFGDWIRRGLGERLAADPKFAPVLQQMRDERAKRTGQSIAKTPAPQPIAVNKTGSSAAGHGAAQPIKKKKKTTTQTSARRSALLFDQSGGGLG